MSETKSEERKNWLNKNTAIVFLSSGLLLSLIANFWVRPPRSTYTVFGFAAAKEGDVLTCAQWLESMKARNTITHQHTAWMNGFLSGIDYLERDIKTVSFDQRKAWVSNYCNENPLKSAAGGVVELSKELRKKKPEIQIK